MMTSTKIIAEIGVNHNGDLALAMKMIEAAKDAGADIVKFQTFIAREVASSGTELADYQKRTQHNNSHLAMLQKLELDQDSHVKLLQFCEQVGVEFLSSPFDFPSIELLSSLGLTTFKVPSGELTNIPYLRKVGQVSSHTLLSTGMATLGEIETALEVLEESGNPRSEIIVLHCTSSYPTQMQDVNLRAMQTIKDAFQVSVGYSDHTRGIEIPIAAVAMGAQVIEKHFTLDRSMEGPDHAASLEPTEFTAMVRAIRSVESAMGSGIKRPSPSELPLKKIARKSVVARRPIGIGEVFSADNLAVKRPGTGIPSSHWDDLMGRQSTREYLEDELIQW